MNRVLNRHRGKLILADGSRFDGYLIGARRLPVWGEVVFNTSMTGYQEVTTDPSYAGQLIVFTYPQIGNYGVSPGDSERSKVAARALIVRELSPFFSPAPDRKSLEDFMIDHNLPGLTGIDTRALTRRIRSGGAMTGVIGSREHSDEKLLGLAKEKLYSRDESLVLSVAGSLGDTQIPITPENDPSRIGPAASNKTVKPDRFHPPNLPCAAVIDLGIKKSIIEQVESAGIKTVTFGPDFSATEILTGGFEFLVLSNGPGDPMDVPNVIGKVEKLLGQIPILGICLGFQIAALAMGGTTFKMKFGHRGANQPVVCRRTGRVYITSQNHGYAVCEDLERIPGVEITFINSNDGTVEGFCDPDRGIECLQFHPEASPGPRDTVFLFETIFQKVKGLRDASVA